MHQVPIYFGFLGCCQIPEDVSDTDVSEEVFCPFYLVYTVSGGRKTVPLQSLCNKGVLQT